MVRQWNDLRQPLPVDPISPSADGQPRYRVRGAQSVEELLERVCRFAGRVWQFKDGLKEWITANKLDIGIDYADGTHTRAVGEKAGELVEDFAEGALWLLMCSDLYNSSKHYVDCNRSGYAPVLASASFTTNGMAMLYDGVCKTLDLCVRTPEPVRFRVNLVSGAFPAVLFGDAVEVIVRAFNNWIPMIRQAGILSPNVPEDQAILDSLREIEQHVTTSDPHGPESQAMDLDQQPPDMQKLARDNPEEFIRRVRAGMTATPAT